MQRTEIDDLDDDGDRSIVVYYAVTNETGDDWKYLVVRTQIFSSRGAILEEVLTTEEQIVRAGETATFEAGFSGVKGEWLEGDIHLAHAVVNVIACTSHTENLGLLRLPATTGEPVTVDCKIIRGVVSLSNGVIWRGAPDEDGDVAVEVKAGVQSLTSHHLPRVDVLCRINNRQGGELAEVVGSEELRPGHLSLIGASGWFKDTDLDGGSAAVALTTYVPVASGTGQRQGYELSDRERTYSKGAPPGGGEQSQIYDGDGSRAFKIGIDADVRVRFRDPSLTAVDLYVYLGEVRVGAFFLTNTAARSFDRDRVDWSRDPVLADFYEDGIAVEWIDFGDGNWLARLSGSFVAVTHDMDVDFEDLEGAAIDGIELDFALSGDALLVDIEEVSLLEEGSDPILHSIEEMPGFDG